MTLIDGLAIKIAHHAEETQKILSDRSKEQEMPITSLPMLSKKIWGIQRNRLYVIGARTGVGKSAFAIQCSFDVAKQGKKVLFLSLESTISEILERIFCNRYSVDNFDLTCGHFDKYQDQWGKFTREIEDLNFIISDSIGRTMKEITELIEKMKDKPDLLVIDYVQMIKNISNQKNEDIAEFVKFLRTMAVKNNMAVWLVSQVNRDGAGEMPTMAQLKGCVHGDTLVGGHKIKDVVNKKMVSSVETIGGANSIISTFPSRRINSGVKECLKITTKSGKCIILSRTTKLFNGVAWKMSKQFKKGDKIVVKV